MTKRLTRISFVVVSTGLAFLFILFGELALRTQPALAGKGPIVNIPLTSNTITMDGVCNPAEYSNATVVTVTVGITQTIPFPVFMEHTNTDTYFCFGRPSGLPQPKDTAASVAVYIDPDNNTSTLTDDFGVWVPFDATTQPFAHTWLTDTYNGLDPTGWQAVKSTSSDPWSAEFKISNQTMGGGNHSVGLALFYHWYAGVNDDYSWPANGIWRDPPNWANAGFDIRTIFLPLISHGP